MKPQKKQIINSAPTNVQQKAEIDNLLKLIAKKIHDPKSAQKAALIISDMINKEKGK